MGCGLIQDEAVAATKDKDCVPKKEQADTSSRLSFNQRQANSKSKLFRHRDGLDYKQAFGVVPRAYPQTNDVHEGGGKWGLGTQLVGWLLRERF